MSTSFALRVSLKKLRPQAIVPKFQTEGAAGFDLHACIWREDEKFGLIKAVTIDPGSVAVIGTGIAVSLGNPSLGLFLFSRSGLGRQGICLANGVGVVDSDYQGELILMLRNESKESFTVTHGDRIAQGVFMPVGQAQFVEVENFDVTTERGANGFGSTGTN